jgi:hypothetical protein
MSGSGVSIELSAEQVGMVLHASVPSRSRGWAGGAKRTAQLRVAGNSPGNSASGSELSRSLHRGLQVWAAFPANGAVRAVAEIARELEMSKTTAHRYVSALVEVGLLERDPVTRQYRIPRILRV